MASSEKKELEYYLEWNDRQKLIHALLEIFETDYDEINDIDLKIRCAQEVTIETPTAIIHLTLP